MPVTVQPKPQAIVVIKPKPSANVSLPLGPIVPAPYIPDPVDGGSF